MWKRINSKGISATRHAVRMALKILRPHLVEDRRLRRLHRRSYANPGPNFCWHIDGYDKLKPFGFAIHGAIDVFSRRMLWLKVGPTNNNPQAIGLHFVRALLQLKVVPCLIRTDRGTENVHIEKIQKFLRRNGGDMLAAENSFIYGKSTGNQRIESWWAILRRQCTYFWINLFKDMQTVGLINTDDNLHMCCLRFCFLHLIEDDLQKVVSEWNSHRIQANKKQAIICAKPDKMYFIPEEFETALFAAEFNEEEISPIEFELEMGEGEPTAYDPNFVKIVDIVFPEWERPRNATEAQDLYVAILSKIASAERNL